MPSSALSPPHAEHLVIYVAKGGRQLAFTWARRRVEQRAVRVYGPAQTRNARVLAAREAARAIKARLRGRARAAQPFPTGAGGGERQQKAVATRRQLQI